MRLYEFEAAAIFKREGIPVPDGDVAKNPSEVKAIAGKIGFPVVLKTQVLVGGRGLAGGVQFAVSAEEAEKKAEELFSKEIKGIKVDKLLIVKKIDIEKELYLSVTIDRYKGEPMVIASSQGGVTIEEIAKKYPEKIISHPFDIVPGLRAHEARDIAKKMGLTGMVMVGVGDILYNLMRVFKGYDAMIAEVNPLVISKSGEIWAIDAKLEVDDSALYRHKDIKFDIDERITNPMEKEARKIGISYVDLDGEIGIISSGAGLGMATMDIISRRYKPGNFLETGGGITEELMYKVTKMMLKKPRIKAIFINLYGGINPIHEGAKGVVKALAESDVKIPVVAKALGNRQEETWETFRSGGVKVVTHIETEKCVEEFFDYLKSQGVN